MSNKLELEYAQSLPPDEAFEYVSGLLQRLASGTLPLHTDESIHLDFPAEMTIDIKLKDKPQKGGKLVIKMDWDESAYRTVNGKIARSEASHAKQSEAVGVVG
jgi:CRISPR/Cas system-associated protein Cas10 (large subunit of type III CRISPR-Cas system)